ncbi:hypothetical protein ACX80N_12315 [Arthrobacter sp. MDT2-16]
MRSTPVYALSAIALMLLTGCSTPASGADSPGSEQASPAAAVETAAPVETTAPVPDPTTFPISGDYAADLAAVRSQPDPDGSFRAFLARQVCERDMDSPPPVTWTRDITLILNQSGITPDLLRLTAAYDCPDRSIRLNSLLQELEPR